MPTKVMTNRSVFDAAVDRLVTIYEKGDRVVLSFSAGKDSGVCLELCVIAAEMTGRLPVEVVMRDEEILPPGTFEYAERIANRKEVSFNWIIEGQPIVNIYNREDPYFWVFDELLSPDQWVRKPPSHACKIPYLNIDHMVTEDQYPPPEGGDLCNVLGLRTQESSNRYLGLLSSGGWHIPPSSDGKWPALARPIYDWTDGDVWKFIKENNLDYNHAYDTFFKMGARRQSLRIGPPTMTTYGLPTFVMAARAWPEWFERVAARCPGVRLAVNYGIRCLRPTRREGETWEQCFKREDIKDAPKWIAERSTYAMDFTLRRHSHHATSPFPEIFPCNLCGPTGTGSWKGLAYLLYNGDPFSLKVRCLPFVEPDFFRPGSGFWNGKPTW